MFSLLPSARRATHGIPSFTKNALFVQKIHGSVRVLNSATAEPIPADEILRKRLKDDLKTAMKSKDSVTSTVIRSIMSTFNNAEKANDASKKPASILDIIHKAKMSRASELDAAEKYRAGGREDLATSEVKEADLLTKYLPRSLSDEEIEQELRKVISGMGSEVKSANLGSILRAFYQNFEKQQVNGGVLAATAKRLLQESSS